MKVSDIKKCLVADSREAETKFYLGKQAMMMLYTAGMDEKSLSKLIRCGQDGQTWWIPAREVFSISVDKLDNGWYMKAVLVSKERVLEERLEQEKAKVGTGLGRGYASRKPVVKIDAATGETVQIFDMFTDAQHDAGCSNTKLKRCMDVKEAINGYLYDYETVKN